MAKYRIKPYHSRIGIDYTESDLVRIAVAKRYAATFMRNFTQRCNVVKKEMDKLQEEQNKLQKKFDEKCRLFSNGLSNAEVREILGFTPQDLKKAVAHGRISRKRLPHTRGGQYSYSAQDVFRIVFEREHQFTPIVKLNNY